MTTQTVSQAVAQQDTGPVAVMWSKKTHFGAVLPDHIDVKSFLGTAAAALYADPKLMHAAAVNPDSLIIAMMECASLGHRPGTEEYYLLWRNIYDKNTKTKRPTVQGLEGYKGIIERMYRSGAVAAVVVREVCANDRFRYVEGTDTVPLHSIGGDDVHSSASTGADFFGEDGGRYRGDMVGVYAYARLIGGAVSRVVLLSRADVMAARSNSESKDSEYSPWNRLDGGEDHAEFRGRSMWWKTAARRLEPWVPTSAEYRREMLRASAAAASFTEPRADTPLPAGPAVADVVDAELIPDSGPVDAASTDTGPGQTGPATPDDTKRPAAGSTPARRRADG